MKVKICGITRDKDIRTCEENKADLIGFINIKRSSRFVCLDTVIQLTSTMEDKTKAVLVLEPDDLNEAINIIKKSKIGIIQLHSLSCEDIHTLRGKNPLKTSLKIVKAIGIPEKIDIPKMNEIEDYAGVCDCILFDSQIKGKTGGTGKQIPLNQAIKAAKLAKNINKNIKLSLAGGINAERIKNYRESIELFFDYLDINSGVEDQPGLKNPQKIKKFMEIAKNQ